MPEKTINRSAKNRDVQVALSAAPDYSDKFTREVMSLHPVLAEELAAPVEHDDDMNYSSAQKLVFWLDNGCVPVAPRDSKAVFRLIVFVSSRGPFVAFITLGLSSSTAGWKEKGLNKPGRYWSVVANDNLPNRIKELQKSIVAVMKANQYTILEGSLLSQAAEGHWTKLDGRPATVFEDELFSEMC